MSNVEFVRAWRASDCAHAIDQNDRAASESIDTIRMKLSEGLLDAGDALRLCTSLGTSLAAANASPSFVTSTVINVAALPERLWRKEGAVALLEAYVREVREKERVDVTSRWSRGWTRLDERCAVAIADAPPDEEFAQDWLARVAGEIARSGVSEVRVTGSSAHALATLLAEFGISVHVPVGRFA